MNEEEMRKLTEALNNVAKEVHDTKSSVNELHKRQNAADQRLENLTKDHLQLKDSINTVSSEVRLMERIAQVEKDKNAQTHSHLSNKIEDVRMELRTNMGEIRSWQTDFMNKFSEHDAKEVADRKKLLITLVTILGGVALSLSVLLYQKIDGDIKALAFVQEIGKFWAS